MSNQEMNRASYCDGVSGSAAALYSVWKKLPVPLAVDSITIIVSGRRRIPEQAERTMSSGDLPSVFFHSPTSERCTSEYAPPRHPSGRSAVPIFILQLR